MPTNDSSKLKSIVTQMNVLNSKMQLLVQEFNELRSKFTIISRTVISQKNLIEELNTRVESVEGGETRGSFSSSNSTLEKEIESIKEELGEMKYVLDSVNPIAYVTVDEVADVVDQKLKDAGITTKQRKKK